MDNQKPVKFSHHALEQLNYRGTSQEEIVETINHGAWENAELGRSECRKDFAYNKDWNGKHYKTKQVRPIFVEEPNAIEIVTVYVYYF